MNSADDGGSSFIVHRSSFSFVVLKCRENTSWIGLPTTGWFSRRCGVMGMRGNERRGSGGVVAGEPRGGTLPSGGGRSGGVAVAGHHLVAGAPYIWPHKLRTRVRSCGQESLSTDAQGHLRNPLAAQEVLQSVDRVLISALASWRPTAPSSPSSLPLRAQPDSRRRDMPARRAICHPEDSILLTNERESVDLQVSAVFLGLGRLFRYLPTQVPQGAQIHGIGVPLGGLLLGGFE